MTEKKKPYIATGGNVTADKLPRFVSPATRLLTQQRAQGRVKPESFRGQDMQRIRGRELQRIREEMLMEDPLCAECRRQGRIRAWDEVDHIIPLYLGGEDTKANRQGLCYECHEIKSAKEREDFASSDKSKRKPPGGG